MSKFIVKTNAAKAPNNSYGRYVRVAVLEVEDGVDAFAFMMISEKAKGVIRIVKEWEPSYFGSTNRSAGRRNEIEARELVRKLNCPLERMVMAVK